MIINRAILFIGFLVSAGLSIAMSFTAPKDNLLANDVIGACYSASVVLLWLSLSIRNPKQ